MAKITILPGIIKEYDLATTKEVTEAFTFYAEQINALTVQVNQQAQLISDIRKNCCPTK